MRERENSTLSMLQQEGISLNESIGQHILVDEKVLDFMGQQVSCGANVLEVGTGPGNITRRIAQGAKVFLTKYRQGKFLV